MIDADDVPMSMSVLEAIALARGVERGSGSRCAVCGDSPFSPASRLPDSFADYAILRAPDTDALCAGCERILGHEIRKFLAAGPAYLGVSWGKDSVVTADLALRSGLRVPLVWVRVDPIYSPECPLVRDRFLELHPDAYYHEIAQSLWWDGQEWRAKGTLEAGFAEAVQRLGADRYISGIRAEESKARSRRLRACGISTERTCAPLSRWTSGDVFAYLYVMRLPVHPAYAMTLGGRLDRGRLRVSSLGMTRGAGVGKLDWEHAYYGDRIGRNVVSAP